MSSIDIAMAAAGVSTAVGGYITIVSASQNIQVASSALDSSNNFYVYASLPDASTQTYILKLDSNGAFVNDKSYNLSGLTYNYAAGIHYDTGTEALYCIGSSSPGPYLSYGSVATTLTPSYGRYFNVQLSSSSLFFTAGNPGYFMAEGSYKTAHLYKLGASGAADWCKTFSAWTSGTTGNGAVLSVGTNIIGVSNSNVCVVGAVEIDNLRNSNIIVSDSNGSIVWQKYFTGGNDYACGACATNNYVYVAASGSYLAQFNASNGTLNWQRVTNCRPYGNKSLTADSSDNVYGYDGGRIYKYNSSGTVQWQREITMSTGSLSYGSITWKNGFLYISSFFGNPYAVFTLKIPDTGAGVGTYTVGSYTVTIASASSDSAGSRTSSAGDRSFTDTTLTSTNNFSPTSADVTATASTTAI